MLRVKIYEEQWGGFTSDYITYFKSVKEVEQFQKETGHKTEILEEVNFN